MRLILNNETRRLKAASEFEAKANLIHNNLYDYSQTVYINSRLRVSIICPTHGVFEMPPNQHINGSGCVKCASEARNKARSAPAKAEFEAKASLIHGNHYSYELVDYKNSSTKVKILCNKHGVFEQRPHNHLQGNGCPVCANIAKALNSGWSRTSFVEKCNKNNNGLGILYILECFNDNEHFYKIGITSRSVKKRYSCTTDMPYAYSVVKEIVGDGAYIYDLETKLHQINKENQYIPSIPFSGSLTECFKEYKEN